MPVPKFVVKKFSEPEKLNDKWLIEHSQHSLLWSVHTVFNGKHGVKYRECRCYTCRKIAQLKLEEVCAESQPMLQRKRNKRSLKKSSFKKSSFNTGINND
jgi:hypothetical protein